MKEAKPFQVEVLSSDLIATDGALEKFNENEITQAFMHHVHMDWSDMDPEDQELNRQAVADGRSRVLSAYRIHAADHEACDLWVITEADRSTTTILLPEEY